MHRVLGLIGVYLFNDGSLDIVEWVRQIDFEKLAL